MKKINKSDRYDGNKFLNYTPSPEMNFIKMLPTPIVGKTLTINENLKTEHWWEELLMNAEIAYSK